MVWLFILLWAVVAVRLISIGLDARRGLRGVPLPHLNQEPAAAVLVAAPDVSVHPDDVAAARSDMTARGLDVVHLLPGAAPASYALGIGRLIDGDLSREHSSGSAAGTAFALLTTPEVLEMAGGAGRATEDAARHVRLARRLGRYGRIGYVQAPRSRLDDDPLAERATIGEAYVSDLFLVFSTPLMLVLTALGPWLAPVTGWLALGALHAQVPLALIGAPVRIEPSNLLVETAIRWLDVFGRWARAMTQTPRRLLAEDAAPKRAWYAEAIAGGMDHLFDPRRDTCPICGSDALTKQLEIGDIWQGKPGRFRLDRCRGCEHVFQNPALSIAGLEYYYGDFYDGLGEDGIELLFDNDGHPYEERIDMVLDRGTPAAWLDVGCGHGHLCRTLKRREPTMTVDGLDLSESVDDAARRGWLDTAHRGLFPELAASLRGQYDAVSMSHYLEHTRDPRAEVAAAAEVLRPGGFFLVEVPDPSSWWGRFAGRFWLPWFQPQHQHFVPLERLEAICREHGMEPLGAHRAKAHMANDGTLGAVAVLVSLAPTPEFPWRPPVTSWARWRTSLVWGFGGPLLLLGVLFDLTVGRVIGRYGANNTYRMVARKR